MHTALDGIQSIQSVVARCKTTLLGIGRGSNKNDFGASRFISAAACAFLLAVLLIAPNAARAQANSATFYGTVTDPTGAVIPGAVVTLTEQNTQAVTTKTATDSGDFAFTFVPPGTYTLRINAKGL